ncbi:hypothetical protein [Aeromicrobium sp. UC242_57]|uniref:hypothetical protein n=1 Tax=Aeromicrobium sp. UC242_57 TaxID=3374624 RepID=UPI003789ADBF
MTVTPPTRASIVAVVALVVALLLSVMAVSVVAEERAGYDGVCLPKDSNGVTFVIDFQGLDGNDGREAETIVRCSPVRGNDASIRRTGLQAMVDAGIAARGTVPVGRQLSDAAGLRVPDRRTPGSRRTALPRRIRNDVSRAVR